MGGIAILIRNKIKHQHFPIPVLHSLEATAVLIDFNNRSILIVSAYQPPSRTMHIADYDNLMNLHNNIIMAGDLNSKHTNWGCRVTNPNGNKLQKYISTSACIVSAPSTPTYFPSDMNRLADILDILVTKSIHFNVAQESLSELDSGHNPVIIHLNSPLQFYRPNVTLFKGKPNWCTYSDYINNKLVIPKNITTVLAADKIAEHFTEVVTNAARVCSVTSPQNPIQKNYGALPLFVLTLIQQKHIARRAWQNQRNPAAKTTLNKLTKQVQTALQQFRVNSYSKFLSNIHQNDSSLWKVTKNLLNQETNCIPSLRTPTRLIISDADKCKLFSENLSNTFSLNQYAHNSNDLRVVNVLRSPNFSVQNSINFATPGEIKTIIKRLPNKKSPGHDNITNLMYKKLPNKAIMFMTSLFNSLLRLGHFPENWKKAIIILIKKPGKDKSDPDSYRPISLLTSLSKIFEKVILSILQNYLNCTDTIPKFQFGFKAHHSTTQQLMRITEHISNSYEKHCHTGAVFIDISKAFDKVWHHGLLYKLKIINTPNYLLNSLTSFLSNRQFSVKINDNFSSFQPIAAGVPQGSILGPTLFNIYTSDIPQSPHTNIALFADDTVIYSESRNPEAISVHLQNHLNALSVWCKNWKISINPTKSPTVKYLGVTLDKRLTWWPHLSSKLQQAHQRLGMLFPILNRKSSLQKNLSQLIYKQVLRPLITYACPIWGNCAQTHLKKLQIFQNKVLRTITNAPWFVRNSNIHNDLKISTIQDHIKFTAVSFFESIHRSTGSMHYRINIRPPPQRRLKRGRPHDLIPQDTI
ncbi:hypothetical protein QTP88_010110 [Uroleucon formosanum]